MPKRIAPALQASRGFVLKSQSTWCEPHVLIFDEMQASCAHVVTCPHLSTGRTASAGAPEIWQSRQRCPLERAARERRNQRGTDDVMAHAYYTPACKHSMFRVAGAFSIWPPAGPVAGLCPNAAGGGKRFGLHVASCMLGPFWVTLLLTAGHTAGPSGGQAKIHIKILKYKIFIYINMIMSFFLKYV